MKELTKKMIFASLLAFATLALAACSDDNDLEDAAGDFGDAIEDTGDAMTDAAEDAADEIEDATN